MGARTMILLVLATAMPAIAAPPPDQVRFAIAPNAADPAWKTAGVKFEKRGECYRIRSAPSTRWPPASGVVAGQGNATAPLFNPGLVQPGNSYVGGPTEDNTLYVQMTNDGTGQSIVCRGTILADGKDVTLRDGSDLSARSYASVSNIGPMGVAPKLDARALAGLTAAAGGGTPQLVHVVIRQGKLSFTQKDWIDLDAGTVGGNAPGVDLKMAPAPYASTPTWQGMNGAKIGYPPQAKPHSYADCAKQAAKMMSPADATPHTGTPWEVCVRTSEGRLAAVRTNVSIVKVGSGNQDWAYEGWIEYVVWS